MDASLPPRTGRGQPSSRSDKEAEPEVARDLLNAVLWGTLGKGLTCRARAGGLQP